MIKVPEGKFRIERAEIDGEITCECGNTLSIRSRYDLLQRIVGEFGNEITCSCGLVYLVDIIVELKK
jgi:hypothetical protein